ncbi:MAG TPA: divalent-cation tolerance protein CutA [Spirochaetia bacterium]|nr:divalent-cation tolerance protein CutA [Spirochaetia bacterium]
MSVPEPGVVLISAPGDKSESIARRIVEERLAACAQVTAEVASLYWWKGTLERDVERIIILKTDRSQIPAIRDLLGEVHPYEVPELVFLPVTAGNEAYLSWLSSSLSQREQDLR